MSDKKYAPLFESNKKSMNSPGKNSDCLSFADSVRKMKTHTALTNGIKLSLS